MRWLRILKNQTIAEFWELILVKIRTLPLNNAAQDYLYCLAKVYNFASYIVINISSPNTPDLRLLQQKEYFRTFTFATM